VARSKWFVLGLAMVCVCAASRPAWAQVQTAPPAPRSDQSPEEPKTNLMFGYAYLYDSSWSEHLLYGFTASITHRIKPTLALVGEAGGSHGEYGSTGFMIQRYAFLGGIRILAGEAEVRPFFQVLAGYSRQGGDVGIANGIAVQPGGGADLDLNDSITLRVEGDYRYVREDGENYSQYRISGGIVLHLDQIFGVFKKKKP
jgi:opacity protein-like surface antigen